jgi:predicted GNAT family N-acyltransferase
VRGRPRVITVSAVPASIEVIAITEQEQLRRAFHLRREVFCGEQGVDPRAEFDGRDEEAVQFAAYRDGRLVGTCRLLLEGASATVQRVAVERAQRRGGVGAALMTAAEAHARAQGAREIVLHAQRSSEEFYVRLGYRPEGGTFLEEGIEHVSMRRQIG